MELPALIALETGVEEPYVLTWSPEGSEEGLSCYAYVVMKRKDGLLLAVPPLYLPVSVLQRASGEEDYLFGPHTKLVVPAVKEEGAAEEVADLDVLVIDVKEEIAGFLRAASDVDVASEEIVGFSIDEFLFPESEVLLKFSKEWLDLLTHQRAAFYSAEERSEAEVPDAVPETPGPGRRPREQKKARVTTATLAAQISEVTDLLPNLVAQVTRLQQSQEEMQKRFISPQLPVPPRGSQLPVSGQVADFAKMVGVPPRTKGPGLQPPATVQQGPKFQQPGADNGMTPQEDAEEHSPQGDALARAMLEQSKALSCLVAQMQQSDPLLDQAASSAGTSLGSKGAMGREKLQQELSLRTGGFYMSVLQNAIRRMRPASKLPTKLEEVPQDFSMVTYLERFGGYGGSRDLGLVQFNLAHIFDAALTSDLEGMKEHLVLLMVAVEQAVQDNNRWELAYQLCLLEEPPTQVWQHRGGQSHRTRAYAPLCPQRWATVSLAYTKEVDFIQTKRQELVKKQVPPNPAPKDPAAPKKKPKFPRQRPQGAEGEGV